MSSFLLNRTKDMVNKYRQLLVREAQVSPPGPPPQGALRQQSSDIIQPCLPVVNSRRVRRQRW